MHPTKVLSSCKPLAEPQLYWFKSGSRISSGSPAFRYQLFLKTDTLGGNLMTGMIILISELIVEALARFVAELVTQIVTEFLIEIVRETIAVWAIEMFKDLQALIVSLLWSRKLAG
jgi:hypothetical protein